MNLREAYSTLELSEGTSLSDAKKKYRELSKKYHPDVNKDPGSEDKFKKINEAYNRIQKGEDDPVDFAASHNPFDPFNGFNPFNRTKPKQYQVTNIVIDTNISFQESVLGSKKEISFKRKSKCQPCNGQGESIIDNGCTNCKGKGQVTSMQGNMIFVQTCNKCYGKVKTSACTNCGSSGLLDSEVTITVTIPGGVMDGNVLRLAGMGNFAGQFMSADQYSDVHLYVRVSKDSELSLEGTAVISKLEISLLEAIRGCAKTVKTVLGNKEIIIKPLSRNYDQVIIPNMGVNRIGDQKVILDVKYPKNTANIIDALLQSEDK
jgi:molecular chaperone DnaJ